MKLRCEPKRMLSTDVRLSCSKGRQTSVLCRTTGHLVCSIIGEKWQLIFSVFPILHQDFSTLPTQNQASAKHLYIQWLALVGTLIVNLVGAILLLVAGSSDGG